MSVLLSALDCIVLDVDGTIAPIDQQIATPIIQQLRRLIETVDIAIVTARSIHEGLELLAHAFFQVRTERTLYFFTCSGTQGYAYDPMTGGLLKLYDHASADPNFQQYLHNYAAHLTAQGFELVPERQMLMPDQKQCFVVERGGQITLHFSNMVSRHAYQACTDMLGLAVECNGDITLHLLPKHMSKQVAMDYLLPPSARCLVLGDGFYQDMANHYTGNDLVMAQHARPTVRCVQVGHHQPPPDLDILYWPDASCNGWQLTHKVLEALLAGQDVAQCVM